MKVERFFAKDVPTSQLDLIGYDYYTKKMLCCALEDGSEWYICDMSKLCQDSMENTDKKLILNNL